MLRGSEHRVVELHCRHWGAGGADFSAPIVVGWDVRGRARMLQDFRERAVETTRIRAGQRIVRMRMMFGSGSSKIIGRR